MRRTIALFACMILCGISVPSRAAEITCAGQSGNFTQEQAKKYWPSGRMPVANVTCAHGYLTGEISKGDYEKVEALLRTNEPFLFNFILNSPGGDVDEALKIGRLLRKYLIATTAPFTWDSDDPKLFSFSPAGDVAPLCRGPNCTCASACALTFLGGVARSGTVGLHRPQIIDPMFRGLSPADASIAYRQLLKMIADYLDEMEVPKPIIESMIATDSSDIRWVDAGDAGLDRPPSIAEWEDASCGPRPILNFEAGTNSPTNARDYLEHGFCETRLLSSHRDRNTGSDFAWRYLLLAALVVVSVWLIMRRFRVTASTVTTGPTQCGNFGFLERARAAIREELVRAVGVIGAPKDIAQVRKKFATKEKLDEHDQDVAEPAIVQPPDVETSLEQQSEPTDTVIVAEPAIVQPPDVETSLEQQSDLQRQSAPTDPIIVAEPASVQPRQPRSAALVTGLLGIVVVAFVGVWLANTQWTPLPPSTPATAGTFEDGSAAFNRGDYATALRIFRPLADRGDGYAQYDLGLMYLNGQGVSQNYSEAMKWFRLAADQGHAFAENSLGYMYFNGRGMPQNYVNAYIWFSLAAAQGDQDAVKNYELTLQHMTVAEIAAAQKLVREWKPKSTPR